MFINTDRIHNPYSFNMLETVFNKGMYKFETINEIIVQQQVL